MNKRHYEHTLPNIRGSLSNTYREVIFAMFKGTSRHPSQDYKNFGTRFRGSCTKFHRILQQCAPLFFGLCFLSTFHSSTIHFSILRVSALKFTPI